MLTDLTKQIGVLDDFPREIKKKVPIFWGNVASNFWTPEDGNIQEQY